MEGACVVDAAVVTTWCCVELVRTLFFVVVACPVSVVVAKNFGAVVTVPLVEVVGRGMNASVVTREVVPGIVVEAVFCVVVATNFGTSHALVTLFLTYPRTQTHSFPL